MMIDNIDVADGLCNGSLGTVRAILRAKNGEVQFIMVQFDNEGSGQEMQRIHPVLCKGYPGCTPIKKKLIKYSTSANSKGARANAASVQQFPLIISFASTTHKIQGATIEAPKKVAVDLRTVFGANQAYVMLGRVQRQDQLSIIDSLPENKIYPDKSALEQLSLMKERSINRNPPIWERSIRGIRVYFHNIQSLGDKFEDIKADVILSYADMIIFAETWLDQTIEETDDNLQLQNYKLHLNSNGRGKGLAVYYKECTVLPTEVRKDIYHQISKFEGEELTVLCVYRSYGDMSLASDLKELIPLSGPCLVIGDFNLCSKQQVNHQVFEALKVLNFKLLTVTPTHLKGGHIDQAWFRGKNDSCDLVCRSPYYTCKDHDALLFTSSDCKRQKGSFIYFI